MGYRSPQVIVLGVVMAVGARVLVSAATETAWWSRWDVLAVAVVVSLIPLFEWMVHLLVLHAEPRRIGGLTIDTGFGHRQHHLNPAIIDSVLLRGLEAGLFQAINASVVVAIIGVPLSILEAPVVGPVLTGVVAAVVGLAHYEWSHFLFHVSYRPKTRYYRRLKANHRLHHWRNERYWLGVTTNLGDRLLRTYPAKGDVPRSPTAKTLGIEPEVGR